MELEAIAAAFVGGVGKLTRSILGARLGSCCELKKTGLPHPAALSFSDEKARSQFLFLMSRDLPSIILGLSPLRTWMRLGLASSNLGRCRVSTPAV